MAAIVLIHGIGQEQDSALSLQQAWLPFLAGGVGNAQFSALADRILSGEFTSRMAYYGDLFLKPDSQGDRESLTEGDQPFAEELALDLLQNAAQSPNPQDQAEASLELEALGAGRDDVQGSFMQAVVSAAAALDRLPWFGRGVLPAAAVVDRTLTQVIRYQCDSGIHDAALARVKEHLTSDTRVVIGHSLGSVLAYDALRMRPADQPVPVLVTLGSPLGLSAINRRLVPQPPAYPAAVQRWVNIAAPDDIVAARRDLHAAFDRDRPDGAVFEDTWKVENGSKPHNIEFYLTKKSCGAAVASALT